MPAGLDGKLRRQRFAIEDFADDEENSVILKSAFCADR
jgi:hypothetical protein